MTAASVCHASSCHGAPRPAQLTALCCPPPHSPSPPVCAPSLDPSSPCHAAYCDTHGALHYVHFDSESGAVTPLARYQLHIVDGGTPSGERRQHTQQRRRPLQKPWAAFDFVPGRPGELLIAQQDSRRVLYAALPRAEGAAGEVFLFGGHT
ncbi:hypothetical protein MNEG_2919, partial [Monoraphidium neglectum]